jgi:hypothetical protein
MTSGGPLILLVGEQAEAMAPRLEASGYRTAPVGALPDPPAAVLVSGADGVATIPALRMILEEVPILLDLVNDSIEARSLCFSSGADDFWLSSAGGSDLLMRLRLLLQIRGRHRSGGGGLVPPPATGRPQPGSRQSGGAAGPPAPGAHRPRIPAAADTDAATGPGAQPRADPR